MDTKWEVVSDEDSETTLRNRAECAKLLGHLGVQMYRRYLKQRNELDLQIAVQLTREAVAAAPETYPYQARLLNNLCRLLGYRHAMLGSMLDLNEACRVAYEAVGSIHKDHPEKERLMSSLGNLLHDRYVRKGNIADLDEALRLGREVVDVTPKDHPERAQRLHNLGVYMFDKSSRTGALTDLKDAILFSQESIKMMPEDFSQRARALNNLGILLGERGTKPGAISEFEDAITMMREAVKSTPEHSPDRLILKNNLGALLYDIYSKLGNEAHFEEAIQLQQEATYNMPKDHPERAKLCINQGGRCCESYAKTGSIEHLAEAIGFFHSALDQVNSPLIFRITAGRKLLQCCAFVSNWQEASKVSKTALDLIPKLVSRSLEHLDKQHMLSQIVGLASDAAAAALNAGSGPLVALEFLEQGRCVLAASLEEMRTDITCLQETCPELAEQFIRLRNEFAAPGVRKSLIIDNSDQIPWQIQANRRHEMENDFDKMIVGIRKQQGLENFLLPPTEADIKAAAKHGPVVIINMSKYRCDAILIEQDKIRSLPLPLLTTKETKGRGIQGLRSSETLEWLWDAVTSPILDALGFTQPPPRGKWPYIWWVPTGSLSKFPIHAAGYHGKHSHKTVLDRVISSYSSSIKIIILGQRPRKPSFSPDTALLVAMEHTPGYKPLEFANEEVSTVRGLCKEMALCPIEPGRNKQEISSHFLGCKIFHFAGHGYAHALDPSQSQLLLDDWKSDPLRVIDLLEINLRERAPFLAYLSACETGRIEDEKFFDENIHLISACQLAGFRHVIGTLWEVNDKICVDIARNTYKGMRDGKMTDESVRRGLHDACRQLRANWLGDVRAKCAKRDFVASLERADIVVSDDMLDNKGGVGFLRDGDLVDDSNEGIVLPHWIPFVHFGV